ncbi:prepilin-type N-terminal cleavage/methylation domain-containing protein [Candidatus Kaiserbacteria bacterium]|nr:prepilin-type N-terminal cleavage/methylation domain-containing protein [Candidatus Kaiserbacteria bacterium]USN92478.1 MAG: prepilin-type N-terminal cleavage/methylation domain-containing protein [Candidatus Nomurabacteria bacterium]
MIIEQKGMTLVELIVTISLYTILMLAISSSVFNLYQSNSYAVAQAGEINNARIGMTEWGSNTKEMTTAEDGTYPVVVMEEHRFGYYSDIDQDSSVEYIEYILSGTTLTRYTYDPSGSPATYNLTTPDSEKTLSLYVQNINQSIPTFLYYDNAGNQLTATSPIIDLRYIKAQIIVNIDPVKSPGEFMLRSSVAPRNLKDNL